MKNRNTKRERILAVSVVVAVVFILATIALFNGKDVQKIQEQTQEMQKERRLIDGVFVLPEQVNSPIAGVMVENMIEAQPISGIADARLVFEAVTEANITRFLAYFVLPSPAPTAVGAPSPMGRGEGEGFIEIGPVRSARPYYLNFAAPLNTVFAHVGSSPAAYNLLRKKGVEGVNDLDQWYKSEYFFQKQGRPRPHHLYTTTELLKKASDIKNASFASWKFKSDASPDLRGNVNDIRINYIAPYNVEWLYDKSENYYKRVQWGGSHKDANGKEIIAKNIAVAFMKMKVLDDMGRKEFTTIGEGKGLVFQDGRVIVGTWKKPSARERLRWYDSQDKEVEFNAGITWVEIVPEGYKVEH